MLVRHLVNVIMLPDKRLAGVVQFQNLCRENSTMHRLFLCFTIVGLFCNFAFAAEWGMKVGNPDLKSAHSLTFGTDGILFVGDVKSAAVVAIATGDTDGDPNEVELHVHGIDKAIAKAIGQDSVSINDMAVNPESGVGYVSVSYGNDASPAIVKLMPTGDVENMSLVNVTYSKVELPNPPEDKVVGRRARNYRLESITDLAFSDGKVLVSGVFGAKNQANVRELVFPFLEADKGTKIEIYHGAHGKYEDTAAVKTFVPFKINGEPHLLAGFQCTPLVKFPVKALQGNDSVRGTTLAELGNRNRPLDMFVYQKGGEDFLLLSNTARGVMKISTADVERPEGITERVAGTAGQSFETIEDLKDVVQMDRLNDGHAVVIAKTDEGMDVHTIDLP